MAETFTSTSTEPYDQCLYLLLTEDGKVDSVWDNYESVRDHWMIYHGRVGNQAMKTILPITQQEWEDMTNKNSKPKSTTKGFA